MFTFQFGSTISREVEEEGSIVISVYNSPRCVGMYGMFQRHIRILTDSELIGKDKNLGGRYQKWDMENRGSHLAESTTMQRDRTTEQSMVKY